MRSEQEKAFQGTSCYNWMPLGQYLFLPPEQYSLLNELLLESQTLVQGPHLALHERSLPLSQIPEERERERGYALHSLPAEKKKKHRPPVLRPPRWRNSIFKGLPIQPEPKWEKVNKMPCAWAKLFFTVWHNTI